MISTQKLSLAEALRAAHCTRALEMGENVFDPHGGWPVTEPEAAIP